MAKTFGNEDDENFSAAIIGVLSIGRACGECTEVAQVYFDFGG